MDIQLLNEPTTGSFSRRVSGFVRRLGWIFWIAFLLLLGCGLAFIFECLAIQHRAQKIAQVDYGINSAINELRIAQARQAIVGQTVLELAADGKQEMSPVWRTVAIHYQRHSHAFDGSIQELIARIQREGQQEAELKTLKLRLSDLEASHARVKNDLLTIVRLTDEGRSDDIAAMHASIDASREAVAEQIENLSSFSKISILNTAKQIQHAAYRVFWLGLGAILLGTVASVRWWMSYRPRSVQLVHTSDRESGPEADLVGIPAEQALTERFLLRGVHVLVAEDDITSRRLLARVFENAGAVVTVACDGGHALQQFRKATSSGHPVQLVIADLKMPVLDGLQVAMQLRDVDRFEGPVLALTAVNSPDVWAECMEAGFDDYLSKPLDRKRLLQLATDYLGKVVSV